MGNIQMQIIRHTTSIIDGQNKKQEEYERKTCGTYLNKKRSESSCGFPKQWGFEFQDVALMIERYHLIKKNEKKRKENEVEECIEWLSIAHVFRNFKYELFLGRINQ